MVANCDDHEQWMYGVKMDPFNQTKANVCQTTTTSTHSFLVTGLEQERHLQVHSALEVMTGNAAARECALKSTVILHRPFPQGWDEAQSRSPRQVHKYAFI